MLPADLLGRLGSLRAELPERAAHVLRESAGLCDALRAAGIEVLFLKGQCLASELYGDLTLRHQGDVDLLVRPGDLDRAVETLVTRSFAEPHPARRDAIRRRRSDAWHAVPLVRDDLELDLHWSLRNRALGCVGEERLFSHRRTFTIDGTELATLSREDTLCHLLTSIALDLRRGALRAKLCLDLHLALRRFATTLDWERFLERRDAEGLLGIAVNVLALYLDVWEQRDALPEVARALEPHASLIVAGDPRSALELVGRPRHAPENRAWFERVGSGPAGRRWLPQRPARRPAAAWGALRSWRRSVRGSGPAPDPARIHLGIGAHAIEVTSRAAAPLVWLGEFLTPAFREVAAEPGVDPLRVRFEVEPGRHAELSRRMAGATLRTVEGFTLDGSFSLHPGWTADDGWTWVHEEDGDAFLGVDPSGRVVTVVVRRDATRPRVALMRVVRELATIALLRAGRLPLHASAFLLDSRVVLVCGAKRAGKTSLLVHALRCGAGFLSNDRVFVGPAALPEVRAMPTIVMLRNGTLERFEELERALASARFDRGRTLAECAPGIERPEPMASLGFDRPGISPAQLCHLLGARMEGAAPLGALLFPRIDAGTNGLRLEPMDPARAANLLLQNLLVPSWPARHSELFAPRSVGEVLDPASQRRRCRDLATQALAYDCRLGPDAFATDLCSLLRRADAPHDFPALCR